MKLFWSALACSTLLLADDTLLKRPDVDKALRFIEATDAKTLAAQIKIAEIPAPTFHEGERAKYMVAEFRRVGLADVSIDKQGNVLGWRKGASEDIFVIAAHLDISFAAGVDTRVHKEGERLLGPGIGDDSRGLAVLLNIVEAMNDAQISTRYTILFVANVGEEGLGDLNGVRYLFQESPFRAKLKAFISIDGVDPGRIVTGGTGVKRYRVSLKGPGGHS
jgi:acetylornithine deacetylase/succinyl-diaminopimelate desuccinylase-like protein